MAPRPQSSFLSGYGGRLLLRIGIALVVGIASAVARISSHSHQTTPYSYTSSGYSPRTGSGYGSSSGYNNTGSTGATSTPAADTGN
jgi:hypothetical protein